MNENRKNELMEKAFQLGFDYEKTYRGCSQCTIAAIQDTLDIREDNVFKAATGLAGGAQGVERVLAIGLVAVEVVLGVVDDLAAALADEAADEDVGGGLPGNLVEGLEVAG